MVTSYSNQLPFTAGSHLLLPSVSHVEESSTLSWFIHPIGLRIWFFGYVTWTLEYFANFILLAFSISCGGEFYLSRFLHPIDLRIWFFGYAIWALEYYAVLTVFAFSILCRGRAIWLGTVFGDSLPSYPATPAKLVYNMCKIQYYITFKYINSAHYSCELKGITHTSWPGRRTFLMFLSLILRL